MTARTFRSLAEAERAIRADMTARDRRMRTAVRKTARQTRNWVARNVPRAFGELADSLEVQDTAAGSSIVADAPHAAAVENGSRPHTPPLEPLIRWVELRGLRGLTASGRVKKQRFGPMADPDAEAARYAKATRAQPDHAIASAIRSRMTATQARAWRVTALSRRLQRMKGLHEEAADPATLALARAIQRKIAREGTKPAKYMLKGVPVAREELARFVAEGLPDRE